MGEYFEWSLAESDLLDIDPIRARDLFITFYYSARKAAKDVREEEMMLPSEDDMGYIHATEEVRTMLELAGGDFDKPKKEVFPSFIPILLDKVGSWGVPQPVLDHYRKELHKIVHALE